MELKRVVVTGLGALSPIGNDVATTWENARNGVSGAAPITRFDASKFKTQFACEVKDYNPADHFDRRQMRQLDLYAMFALTAADEAIADAGLDGEGIDKNRVGVIFAAGIGGLHTFEEEAGYFAVHGEEQGPKYNPFFIPKMIADIASGHISMEYGYHGPNYGVVSACASSNNAIIDAFSVRAVQLCEEIFLSDDMMSEPNREKMMIASYIGGMAAGNVGVIHPFSAGLGVVLHVAHGLGNCLALNVLEDIYPKEYKQFRTMIERQGVHLPTGICQGLTEEQYEGLYQGCIVHEKPLTNALGPDFKKILTKENLIERYKSI